MLQSKMTVIDLKSPVSFSHTNINNLKGVAIEFRTDDLFTDSRFSTPTRILQMCSTISRQLQSPEVFMFRSISLHGVCTIDVSIKPARNRNMPSRNADKTLSYWYPRQGRSQHFGRRQRETRLADLRRLRASADSYRPQALCRGRLWGAVGSSCLCT